MSDVIRTNGVSEVISSFPSASNKYQSILGLSGFATKTVIIERPRPTRMLKMGPAMQPVIAISPKPFLVIATSALMSPRQFPQASNVSPSTDLGT